MKQRHFPIVGIRLPKAIHLPRGGEKRTATIHSKVPPELKARLERYVKTLPLSPYPSNISTFGWILAEAIMAEQGIQGIPERRRIA